MSTQEGTKNRGSSVGVQGNVYLGRNEKSGVDPPPSPTTPTSYRQLFCNLTQVHPCGLMHLLVHMRFVGRMPTKICRTTMLNFYKNYKKKLSVRGGCGGGWWRIDPQFFFVPSKVDIFSGLFLEMVISHDNYKVRQREFKYAIQTFPARRLRKMFQSSGTCPSVVDVT